MGWTLSVCGRNDWQTDDASFVRIKNALCLYLNRLSLPLTHACIVVYSDLVLLQDKKFMKYVKVYAKDAEKFNKDFTAAFNKLEELGTSGLTPTEWA